MPIETNVIPIIKRIIATEIEGLSGKLEENALTFSPRRNQVSRLGTTYIIARMRRDVT